MYRTFVRHQGEEPVRHSCMRILLGQLVQGRPPGPCADLAREATRSIADGSLGRCHDEPTQVSNGKHCGRDDRLELVTTESIYCTIHLPTQGVVARCNSGRGPESELVPSHPRQPHERWDGEQRDFPFVRQSFGGRPSDPQTREASGTITDNDSSEVVERRFCLPQSFVNENHDLARLLAGPADDVRRTDLAGPLSTSGHDYTGNLGRGVNRQPGLFHASSTVRNCGSGS